MTDKIKISLRKEYRESQRQYMSLSKNLRSKLKQMFKRVARSASVKYQQGINVDDIFMLEFGDNLYKILGRHYRLVINQTAQRAIRLRKKDTETDMIVDEYIQTNTAQKVTQISETTRALLTATIAQGLADGLGPQDMGKLILRSVAFSEYRATMISRTETHTAMNYAGSAVAKISNFRNPVKRWLSARDVRTRSWHRSMDGTVVKESEKFKVPTPTKSGVVNFYMDFCGDSSGGASNVINCRCMTQYHDEEDIIVP